MHRVLARIVERLWRRWGLSNSVGVVVVRGLAMVGCVVVVEEYVSGLCKSFRFGLGWAFVSIQRASHIVVINV